MRDGTKNGIIYIDEKSYQKLKEELGKENDYFCVKEIKSDNVFDNVLYGQYEQSGLKRQ